VTKDEAMDRICNTNQACRDHANSCHKCFMPIIDAEGNPGYFGEACDKGVELLRAYVDAEAAYYHLTEDKP
jgi:hypothetical protein